MTLRGRSVICPGLLPSRFGGPTGNLPLFDSAWLSGARMLDARTGEGSEERRRGGVDVWAPLLSSAAPPGSGPFCRKSGPDLTPFRGSGRFFRLSAVVRTISRDITPGQKLPYRRCPALRPTKPPRPSPARSRRPAGPAPAAEAPALWVLTLRGRSVICPKIGQITLRPLSVRTAVGSTGASLGVPHTLPVRLLTASRDSLIMDLPGDACTHCAYGDDSGFSFSLFLALYVLRNMPTVLNMRTHRIPRLVGGKRNVYLRQS